MIFDLETEHIFEYKKKIEKYFWDSYGNRAQLVIMKMTGSYHVSRALVTNETAIIELIISVHVPTMFLKSGSMQTLHQNTLDKVESAIELSF